MQKGTEDRERRRSRKRRQREPNWCKRCQKALTDDCVKDHPQRIGYSTPYRRGRGFEYGVINALRKQGCYCFRSYGSKGTFDICAIPPKSAVDRRPLLIQAKRSSDRIDDHELAHMIIVGEPLAARIILATRNEQRRIVLKEILINSVGE